MGGDLPVFDTSRYPGRLSVALEADTIAALEAVAADANASVSSVARECIRRGLEPTREAWRKQKRRGAGTTAEPDTATSATERSLRHVRA